MRALVVFGSFCAGVIVGLIAGFPTAGLILLGVGVAVSVGLCIVPERRP